MGPQYRTADLTAAVEQMHELIALLPDEPPEEAFCTAGQMQAAVEFIERELRIRRAKSRRRRLG